MASLIGGFIGGELGGALIYIVGIPGKVFFAISSGI